MLEQLREEMLDWHGHGMSVMEMSHRGKAFVGIAQQAEADLRELLAVPANYKVLFLQGGATAQFAAVPLNLDGPGRRRRLRQHRRVVEEGDRRGEAILQGQRRRRRAAANYSTVPPQSQWQRSPDAAYLHYTPNETIGGVEFPFVPDAGDVPLVADMSSTILSRPIDVSRFGVIYAGAQKNIGPAGLVVVIVREDLLGRARPDTPTVFDWAAMAADGSMLNTPADVFLVRRRSRVPVAQAPGRARGDGGARTAPRRTSCTARSTPRASTATRSPSRRRSWMNVPFTLPECRTRQAVRSTARSKAGLVALEGHRSVGGMRASIYNAMPHGRRARRSSTT